MFLHFKAFLLSVGLFFAMELVLLRENIYSEVALAFVAFCLIFIWPLLKKFYFMTIPLFVGLGALSLLVLVDGFWEKEIVIGLSFGLFYLYLLAAFRLIEYRCDQTAQGMVNLVTLAAVFLAFVAGFGWYLNLHYSQALPFPVENWLLVAVITLAVFLISLPSFFLAAVSCQILKNKRTDRQQEETAKPAKSGAFSLGKLGSIILLTLGLALIVGQITWAVSFWPFSYLTTGTALLIIYFVLWDVIRSLIQGNLRKNKLIVNSFLAIFPLALLLISASWNLTH